MYPANDVCSTKSQHFTQQAIILVEPLNTEMLQYRYKLNFRRLKI